MTSDPELLAAVTKMHPATGGVAIISGERFPVCRGVNATNEVAATVTFADGSVVENYTIKEGERPLSLVRVVGSWSAGELVALY